MLHLHRAERTDTLADALADLLATPLDDPMSPEIVAVPAGEGSKSFAQLERVLDRLLEIGLDRKDVVIAKRGAAMADKSAAYIDAAFDLLAEDAGKTTQDPIRQRIAAGDTAKVNDEADAWAANLADLNRKPKEG